MTMLPGLVVLELELELDSNWQACIGKLCGNNIVLTIVNNPCQLVDEEGADSIEEKTRLIS